MKNDKIRVRNLVVKFINEGLAVARGYGREVSFIVHDGQKLNQLITNILTIINEKEAENAKQDE